MLTTFCHLWDVLLDYSTSRKRGLRDEISSRNEENEIARLRHRQREFNVYDASGCLVIRRPRIAPNLRSAGKLSRVYATIVIVLAELKRRNAANTLVNEKPPAVGGGGEERAKRSELNSGSHGSCRATDTRFNARIKINGRRNHRAVSTIP